MTGPLDGVRAVVLAGMGPVPYTSMLLADLGAEVVRVDRPAARGARALAQVSGMTPETDVVGRGVDSVVVDLKDPAGRDSVIALAAAAEVFIEGYRPGVAERLGLGPDRLLAAAPALVYARLTGFGQDGPRAREAGHDINYVAASGVLGHLGRAGEAPLPPINLLGDYAGGGMLAALGIVSAVLSARTTGEGQVVDVAMADGAALLTAKLHGLRAAGLYSDERGTNFLDSGAPFYDTYRCADGGYLAVGALEADFYAEFVSRLGVDTADWPAQNDRAQWPRLRALIGEAVAARSRDEWAEVFAGTDACAGPVLTFDEAADSEHGRARGLYRRVGEVLHPAPAPRFSRTPAREPAPSPAAPRDLAAVLDEWRPDSRG
ncbi:MAG: CaiB/BaiF CoA-transferase family protein [Gordonia sp. (in: high G+C Gram-positive bacteria)]|uniref:CaiB/BaiF CoA transferase family protein n=1 Tax=Gordonia sp. (in: high G+C Gram-positive bacteria) TaxID=84139 RepID=UPI0039E2DC9F